MHRCESNDLRIAVVDLDGEQGPTLPISTLLKFKMYKAY